MTDAHRIERAGTSDVLLKSGGSGGRSSPDTPLPVPRGEH